MVSLKVLAEAIILQSIEDLWDARHRSESMSFFSGRGFSVLSKMACLSTDDQLRILNIVKEASGHIHNSGKKRKAGLAKRAFSSRRALSSSPRVFSHA
jgi:hypothetical protein